MTSSHEGQDPAGVEPGPETKPVTPRSTRKAKHPMREWLETVVLALVIALLIRGFLVQVYKVEGRSMEQTLHENERVMVNKLVYRFRGPAPSEIVVLRDPTDRSRELIKRVIAVAGETVEVRQGQVLVNGRPVLEGYKEPGVYDQEPVTVPNGHVYVMGDNRMASLDSRWLGPIPLEVIQGKAFLRFWPLADMGTAPFSDKRVAEQ